MRTLLPCFRTNPSRMFATPSVAPMACRSSFLPLKWNEEVRPATFSPFTRASAFRISSAMPSEKYSWSFVGLRSAKASTAMDGASGTARAAGVAGGTGKAGTAGARPAPGQTKK